MVAMIASLSQLDPASRLILRGFGRKATLIVLIAAAVSLADPQRAAPFWLVVEIQCLVGCAISTGLARWLRQPLNSSALTFWDEAAALSGLGCLGHLGSHLVHG